MPRSVILALALLAAPALADGPLPTRAADVERLNASDALLGRTLAGALAEGPDADVAVLVEAMDGAAGPLAPAGDWNCRTLKLGGFLPLTAYGNFRCRIIELEPGRWRLEKLTGSQRTEGVIYAVEGVAEYYGVGYVDGGPAVQYEGLPPDDQTPVEPGQTHAQVGFFQQMGPDRARILLPDPILESDYDILYLTR